MSYEGYVVYYCNNGHCICSKDAYEEKVKVCPYCGSTKILHDSVNLTNGCDDPENENCTCPCHEEVSPIPISYDIGRKCESCKGTGKLPIFLYVDCNCSDPKQCKVCKGTGKKQYKTIALQGCPRCHGTGKEILAVYDVRVLKK